MFLNKKYSVLIGSDLSVLVLADILSDFGIKVLLVNKFEHWGGIFLGTKIKNERFDYGMMNFELKFNKKKKNLKYYDAEKFNDFVYFQDYIKRYLKTYVNFKKISQIPKTFYKNKLYNDFIMSNYIDIFNDKSQSKIIEKIKSEISAKLKKKNHIHIKEKNKKFDYFLSKSLYKIAIDNYGKTYYREFIKTFTNKVLSISPKSLPAIYHRNSLAPLYYPENLINNKKNSDLKPCEFSYPKDLHFGAFINRILKKITQKKNVTILRNCKNINFFKKNKIVSFDNKLFQYSKIFWSGDIVELAKLNNIIFDYKKVKKKKATLVLFFILVKKKSIKKKFSFILDNDKDSPIYRITNQSLCSGLNYKNCKIIIESNYEMFKSKNIEKEVISNLKKYNIDPKGIIFIEKKYFKNGLLKPRKKDFLQFNILKKKIKKINSNIQLMGTGLNYNANTLNDQILQGIKFSNKIK